MLQAEKPESRMLDASGTMLGWAYFAVFQRFGPVLESEACRVSKTAQLVTASIRTQVQIPVTHMKSKVRLSV